MGDYLIREGHPGYQTSGYRRPKDANQWWWTPERDNKLCYVMETYDDLDKAARVLGISRRSAKWRWYHLCKASGTLTAGGDVKQAPGESLSGPTAEGGDAHE